MQNEASLCGTLGVAVHSACGLQQPACVYTKVFICKEREVYISLNLKGKLFLFPLLSGVYVCLEVDGYEFYDKQAQTDSSVHSINPNWDQVRLRHLLKHMNP